MVQNEIKNLVLTGASRGIGHATVKRFSSAGWRVITCSREKVPEKCPWSDGMYDHVQMDLSSMDKISKGSKDIIKKLDGKPLHALVNNAGISPKSIDNKRLDTISTSEDCWQEVFQVNFFAPIFLAKILKVHLEKGSGSIVNVTSIAGSRVHEFAGSAYATSKAALSALTREMASDFGPLGIRVNAIAPGEIKTDIISPESEKLIVPKIPLGRFGTPEEVAQTIYFLCSDMSDYLNGSEIHINGGQHV